MIATLADVRPYLAKQGPSTGARIAAGLGLPVYGLGRKLAGMEGIGRFPIAITPMPLADGPIVSSFSRYPRINPENGEPHFSPNLSRMGLHYIIYYAYGERGEGLRVLDNIRSAFASEAAKAMMIALEVREEIARRNGDGASFGMLIGGDFSRCLGTLDWTNAMPVNVKGRIAQEPGIIPQDRMQISSDVDLWIYNRESMAGVARACKSLKAERPVWIMQSGNGVKYDLIIIGWRGVEAQLSRAANGVRTPFAPKFKDLLHAVPLPGDAVAEALRKTLDSSAEVRRWWKGLIEGSMEKERGAVR